MTGFRPSATGAVAGVSVLLAYVLAVWVRINYITVLGGTEPYLAWANKHYFGGITPVYLALARSLAAGDGYWVDVRAAADWIPLDPFVDYRTTYSPLLYPPGYPVVIAGLYLLGIEDLNGLRVAQAFLDATGVLGLFLLLRGARATRAVGFVGALTYAVYPLWAAGSSFLLAESLSVVLIVWLLVLILRAADRARLLAWASAGLAAGIAAMIRPDLLLFIGVAVAWLLVTAPRAAWMPQVAALLAAFAIAPAAWGTHNRVVHGEWVFSSTSGGSGLYQGLGEIANNHGYVLSDAKTIELLRGEGLRWGSADADVFLKRAYLRAWREHPEFVLQGIAARWVSIAARSEPLQPDPLPWLRTGLDQFGFFLTIIAAIVFRRHPVALLLCIAPFAYALLSIGLVHWEPRYVRYVHLSYLISALLLVSAALSRLELRFHRLARAATVGLVVVACAAAGTAVAALDRESDSALAASHALTRLAQADRAGNLRPVPAPRWEPTGEGTMRVDGNAVEVRTNNKPFAYQAVARMPVGRETAWLVRFAMDVVEGGATIGALDDAGRWIETRSRSEPGILEGELRLVGFNGKSPTLVLANNNPAGASRFALTRINIQTDSNEKER